MSTKKELCIRLSDEIQELVSEIKELKAETAKAKEAGDSDRVNSLHTKRVQSVRPLVRHRLLALGYLRGKTYHQIEAKAGDFLSCSSGLFPVLPKKVAMHLVDWETFTASVKCGACQEMIEAWLRAGDKTRFELEPVAEPVKPTGLLAQLQAGAA